MVIDLSIGCRGITKKLGLYREIEGEFRPYTEGAIVKKASRSLGTLTLVEFEKIFASSQAGMLPQEIESIFGLDDGAYEALERAYVRIVMVKTNKNTTSNSKRKSYRHLRRTVKDVETKGWKGHFISPIGIMAPPHQVSEQKDARKVFERIGEQLNNEELKSACLDQLRFFISFIEEAITTSF
ncbi:MAG: hypothetical protein LRY63_03055 [Nitrincola sp.]|nr:hypothetical protein [Nitrincola sp.]